MACGCKFSADGTCLQTVLSAMPGLAKAWQDGLGTGKIQQPEIVAGADSRLRVLYPAAFPCQMETKKENG